MTCSVRTLIRSDLSIDIRRLPCTNVYSSESEDLCAFLHLSNVYICTFRARKCVTRIGTIVETGNSEVPDPGRVACRICMGKDRTHRLWRRSGHAFVTSRHGGDDFFGLRNIEWLHHQP